MSATSSVPPSGDAAPDGETKTPRNLHYEFLTVEQILALPDLQWLVKDLLLQKTTSIWHGASESYKTFLVVDLALSIATGREFLGRAVMQGPVIYVAAEDPEGIKPRLRAWLHQYNHADPIPFRMVRTPVPLTHKNAVHPLVEEFSLDIQALVDGLVADVEDQVSTLPGPPVLVIFDTLSKSTTGADVNSNMEMSVAISALDVIRRKLGCHCLIVHHNVWDSPKMKGAASLVNDTDTVISLTRGEDSNQVVMSCEKQKNARHFDSFRADLLQVRFGNGQDEVSLVPVLARTKAETQPRKQQGMPKQKPINLRDELALRILRECGEEGATFTEWHMKMPWETKPDDNTLKPISNATFFRIRDRLERADRILRGTRIRTVGRSKGKGDPREVTEEVYSALELNDSTADEQAA